MVNNIPDKQRALVLQGGVALGAYEAGVFKKLYKEIKEQDPNWEKNMFDIVAGTSAGTINAAILVNHFKEKKTWKYSDLKLEEFWKHLSTPTPPIVGSYWRGLGEAARRYYSTKHFFYNGIENVFSFPMIIVDNKFHDYLPYFEWRSNVPLNTWHLYSNERLKESLGHKDSHDEEYVKFPIPIDTTHPRLLVVSVDVEDSSVVTFDNYTDKSIYGRSQTHTITHPDGIKAEHVMASATFPVFFEYEKIQGRKLWDGGMLSNTPLRELLQAHRNYWKNVSGNKENKVPDLEVYVINVWPSEEHQPTPSDYDRIKDRKNDITYADKTQYDQKVALIITDYVDMVKKLEDLVRRAIDAISDQNNKKQELNEEWKLFPTTLAKSKKRSNNPRTYDDLLQGRFDIKMIKTIERKDDPNDIANKWADFTTESINRLIEEGENYHNTATVTVT
ncbi:MAG: patatin-like phospholipase family protein [Nitrosopumilus sp.]|nr:patatin-like phospholipase family protein [Nitrosopumilus sp.]